MSVLCTVSNVRSEEDEDVPYSKLSQNVGAPTLKIFYWYRYNQFKPINLTDRFFPVIPVDTEKHLMSIRT